MPAIRVQAFKGTAPRVSARLLDPSMAQQADDSRLFNKEVRPYRGMAFVQAAGNGVNAQTIYRYVNQNIAYWFDWATPVQVARVPITGDTKNRIFYTGDGVPKKTGNDIGIPNLPGGPLAFYFMGVKNPPGAPTVVVNPLPTATVTITIASPGVITWTAHGLAAGTGVIFTTTGTLPTGITAGVTYYVIPTGLTANTFQIATTPNGAAIVTTGSQSGTQTGTVAGGATRTAVYVITYVTGWGEEGGVSAPVSITYQDGQTVTVTRAADTPDSHYNIVSWNLYRSITGNTSTGFFLVGNQPVFATTTFTDTVLDANLVLNGSFPSVNQLTFAEPPSDLSGLTAMPNGMLAGFSPSLKQVCLSEPYFPYAWPTNYRRGLVYDPVAAGASGNMLVVATTSKPAAFIGNTPAQLSGDTLDALESCGSVRSLAESPFGVVWATPDGLYMVSPSGERKIITRSLYDKQTWQTVLPNGIFATIYDGRYYGFCPGLSRVLVLDPDEPDDALTFLNIQPTAMFSDFNADGLYFVVAGNIVKWDSDGGSLRQYDWRSKVYTEPKPSNKGWARILFNLNNPYVSPSHVAGGFTAANAQRAAVIALNAAMQIAAYAGPSFGGHAFGEHAFGADDYLDVPADVGSSITLNVYGDAALVATVQVLNEDELRLPGGFLAREWEVEVLAKVNVEEICIANDMSELQQVD